MVTITITNEPTDGRSRGFLQAYDDFAARLADIGVRIDGYEYTQEGPQPAVEGLAPCVSCGVTPEACSFCPEVARHMVDSVNVYVHIPVAAGITLKRVPGATIYFCDDHVELLSHDARDGATGIEVGAYCPNNDCPACDTWT